jgi:hypothetical protein
VLGNQIKLTVYLLLDVVDLFQQFKISFLFVHKIGNLLHGLERLLNIVVVLMLSPCRLEKLLEQEAIAWYSLQTKSILERMNSTAHCELYNRTWIGMIK